VVSDGNVRRGEGFTKRRSFISVHTVWSQVVPESAAAAVN
jgi:hypothetical protein